MSPLELAIAEHDIEAVRFLIDHGADKSSLKLHSLAHRFAEDRKSPQCARILRRSLHVHMTISQFPFGTCRRAYNVATSAAMAMYEYCKQHPAG